MLLAAGKSMVILVGACRKVKILRICDHFHTCTTGRGGHTIVESDHSHRIAAVTAFNFRFVREVRCAENSMWADATIGLLIIMYSQTQNLENVNQNPRNSISIAKSLPGTYMPHVVHMRAY
jgi:hypothetical protein